MSSIRNAELIDAIPPVCRVRAAAGQTIQRPRPWVMAFQTWKITP
ncbi:hypothetical protein [Xanthomonas arboricola]|nr:hypothetical protein [Xanthomonas arboricola]